MEISIDGVRLKGASSDVIASANNLVKKSAMGYSPRSLGEACGVHFKKLEVWLDGRALLLTDELSKVCYALEIKFRCYGK